MTTYIGKNFRLLKLEFEMGMNPESTDVEEFQWGKPIGSLYVKIKVGKWWQRKSKKFILSIKASGDIESKVNDL